jgi:uncharacterized repeat protein (TIGR01451 family)
MIHADRSVLSRLRLALWCLLGGLAAFWAGSARPAVPVISELPVQTPWPAPEPPTPTVAIRVRVPACAPAGADLEYHICVENRSAAPAHHVLVRNPLPANAQFIRAQPGPSVRKPELRWDLGTLPPGACKEILLVLKPTGDGEVKNCARVQFEHGQCVCTRIGPPGPIIRAARPDIRLVKNGPASAHLNATLAYQLTVTNPGEKEITEVQLTDELPEGLDHASGKKTLSWNLGTIAAGKSATVDYQVIAKKDGRLCNKAAVRAAGGLREEASHCVNVGDTHIALKKTGPRLRYLNIPVTYLLTVSNPGKIPLANVVVTDLLPPELNFVRASNDGQRVENPVRWVIGDLAPGQSRTVQVVLQARAEGKVRNRATATADGGVTAEARTETQFKGASALLVEVLDSEDPVAVGAEASYVITIKNQGMIPATNIQIKAVVPKELEITRARGPADNRKGAMTAEGQVILYEPLKTLAPGAAVTYEIFTRALKPGDVRFKVDVTADQLRVGGPVHEEESTTIFADLSARQGKALRDARVKWSKKWR